MRVSVDLDVCQGHGVCHMSAPAVFELDPDDAHSIVQLDPVPAEYEADARIAADACPERAITVIP
ncbi:ferredoxin [Trujillonella endophytica]|uniref:Ferredoxin n=1 Tax=Trujillonella endophytica TaxID=673521 RepID=A0A1H8QHF5_9ACTN|nr:ferredoxin [Trujillella endophytica]SEO53632.1 ferredoxin [Trujillella endophytica]